MAKTIGKPFDVAAPLSQKFGENPSRYAQFGMAGHDGIDYAVPAGTPIFAGSEGKVTKITNTTGGYGKSATVWDQQNNLSIVYAHLGDLDVKVGDSVTPGTQLGKSGNTGNSTGPHLHIGVGNADSAGARTNRGNGYDGWIDPATTITFGTTTPTTTKGGETAAPAPGYTGPTPPSSPPTYAGAHVSINGNFFQSSDGKTWSFRGTDADRRAAEIARDIQEKYIAYQQIGDAGVYLHKSNLIKKYEDGEFHPSDDGLRDAWGLIVKGNWRARLQPGGPGQEASRWFEIPGKYTINPPRGDVNWNITTLEARPKPAPPAPAPLPNQPATVAGTVKTAPPATTPPPPPATGYTPWDEKKAPGTKGVYNLLVAIGNRIISKLRA